MGDNIELIQGVTLVLHKKNCQRNTIKIDCV